MNYLDVANSGFMFILCLIPVAVIIIQAIRFMTMAWKRGLEIGMEKEKLVKCVKTAISISIVPALTLVTLLIAMAPNIGKYFPWLRLSNIGAGGYEPLAAEIGMEAAGFMSYSELTLAGFLVVMFCMNVGMSVAPVTTMVSLKTYDKTLKKAKKTNRFILIGTNAAFLAVLSRLAAGYFTNFGNMLGIVAAVSGCIMMLICMQLKKKNQFFGDFALSLCLIVGVIACVVVHALGIF